jgi:hypothetical protein
VSDICEIEAQLGDLLDGFDPDALPVCDALGLWSCFNRVERLAASAKVLLARRVEAGAAWRHAGFRSVAEQLAAQSGASITSTRSMLETSRRVEALPDTAAALRGGELSTAQAEVVAAAAAIVPDAEARLLATAATSSLSELRNASLEERARVGPDKTHARITRERSLREYRDDEGAWVLHARGPVEAGLAFRAAITPIIDEYFKAKRETDDREPREAYAFDALIELATRRQPKENTKSGRFLGLIRADLEALQRGQVEGDEVCEIAGLGPIPVRIAQDLLGEAVLKMVITNGVDVLNVTHLGRAATMAQKVALCWRSPESDAQGCTYTQRLEIDHDTGWAKTHTTRVDDSNCLCGHHHWLKTVLGWALVEGAGKREMVPPGDPRHPGNRRGPPDP